MRQDVVDFGSFRGAVLRLHPYIARSLEGMQYNLVLVIMHHPWPRAIAHSLVRLVT
jgi:hypothetical protein